MKSGIFGVLGSVSLAVVSLSAFAADRPVSYQYAKGTDNAMHCYAYYTDDSSWLDGEVLPATACAGQTYPVTYGWSRDTKKHDIECYAWSTQDNGWLSGEQTQIYADAPAAPSGASAASGDSAAAPTVVGTKCDGQPKPISHQWSKGITDGVMHC